MVSNLRFAHRLSLLDDDHGKNRQVGVNDAPPDGLALLLTGAPLAEAGMALLEEESDAAVGEDALLHGEALLVVAASDAEGVALPLVAQARRVHVLTHALLVERANLWQGIGGEIYVNLWFAISKRVRNPRANSNGKILRGF